MSDIVDIKLKPVKGTKKTLYKLTVIARGFGSEKKYIRFIKSNNYELPDSTIDLINRLAQSEGTEVKYILDELISEEVIE